MNTIQTPTHAAPEHTLTLAAAAGAAPGENASLVTLAPGHAETAQRPLTPDLPCGLRPFSVPMGGAAAPRPDRLTGDDVR